MFKKLSYLASAAILTSLFLNSMSHAMLKETLEDKPSKHQFRDPFEGMNLDTDSDCTANYFALKILSTLQEKGSVEHKEYLKKRDEALQKEREEELKKYRTSSKHLELIHNDRLGNLGTGVRVMVLDDFAKPESSEDFLANTRLAGKVPLNARGEAKNASIKTCDRGNHGLHVAGLIADDDFGVAPNVQIIPKAFGGDNDCKPLSKSLEEIYENDFGAKIINLSLKFHSVDAKSIRLIKQLCENHLVVWAAGNEGSDYRLNSSLEEVLTEDKNVRDHLFVVSNVNSDGESLYKTSNYFGSFEQKENPPVQAVGIAAVGTDMVSTIAENGVQQFGSMTGTSQAAPLVCGLLARLISDYPEASITEIADLVRQGANREGPFSDPEKFGQGMIDVQNTYRLAKAYFKK